MNVDLSVFGRAFLAAILLVAVGCGDPPRTGSVRIVGPCREGETRSCSCTDGRMGAQVCRAEIFEACLCDGTFPDAGPRDASDDLDLGPEDAGGNLDGQPGLDLGFPPDAGFPTDDAGFPDAGFPADALPFDSGFTPDLGFPDSGQADAFVPPPVDAGFFDSGVRDTGVRPDSGPGPDAGFPDSGPTPCTVDSQCAVPLEICDGQLCVLGCLLNQVPCPSNLTCSFLTGRCDSGGSGICLTDDMCAPPLLICEFPECAVGCLVTGCPNGGTCNSTTGRCI